MEQPVTSASIPRVNPIATRLGVTAWALVMLAQVASIVIWARAGFATPGYVFMRGPAPMLAFQAALVAQGISALILTTKRPDNRIGWIILAFTIVAAASSTVVASTAGLTTAPAAGPTTSVAVEPFLRWLTWIVSWALFPAASFLAFALAFLFPTGRLLSARWQKGLAAVGAIAILAAIALAIRPGRLLLFPPIDSPIDVVVPVGGDIRTALAIVALAVSGTIAAWALAARYRVSDGIVRAQVRWYIAAGVLLAVAYSALTIGILVLTPDDPLGEAIETLFFLLLGIPPIAITIAILRYRLYDIDTIISRAFVYGALTAVLAGIYTASIRLFNSIFVAATGEGSDIALVVTTLVLATSFTPIKRRLEHLAERLVAAELPEAAPDLTTTALAQDARALLEDPAFTSVLDERIRLVLGSRRR